MEINSNIPIATRPQTIARKLARFAGWPIAVDKLVQESFADVKPFEFVTRIEYSTFSPCGTKKQTKI